ncbi:hypothetical protein [Algoriphagus marinus]|uniref:hypothetical protein n=1 Tax=Algoriphagus marinus TaxID=1925762 RepID=UPI00094B9335|nr:hypothetical protein [Algoriphagus marinus]
MKKIIIQLLRFIGFIPQPKKTTVTHEDEVIFKIQDDVFFQVYWKSLPIGKGPAVILKAFGQEILKFDCFGKEKGHYHIAPNYDFRIYFVEETIEEQIQRTILELKINGLRYLKIQKDPKIKAINPNLNDFNAILKQVESTLLQHHEKLQIVKKAEVK